MRSLLVVGLLEAKAEAGTLTVNEASVLRNLLRDNGMTMGLPPPVPG
jgi:DNA-binding MarR family transcriptional regulator